MTRTFGSDNAIAWVQVQLRGGPRNLLSTTMTFSAVVILAMIGTVQFYPANSARVFTGWTTGLLAIQAAILLLLGPARIATGIRQDVNAGIIESHRLMPIAPTQAIIGYILGSASLSLCLAGANLFLGGFAAVQAGVGPGHWLGANALLLAFAIFVWVVIACGAFHAKNPLGFIFFAPALPAFGQGGAIGLVPGLMLLATPILGGSIFDMTAMLGTLSDVYVLSMATQGVLGVLCFVAATRKYRRADVIGFTPTLGLLLLGTWVAASYFGTMWWSELKPTYVRNSWVSPDYQFLTSLLIGMLLALIPILSAGEQSALWVGRKLLNDPALHRRPIRDELVVVLATLILLPLASGSLHAARNERPESVVPIFLAALTVLLHLALTSFLWRTLRFYTTRLNGVLSAVLGALWVLPFLADLVRREALADSRGPVLTEISCISPAGAIVALLTGRSSEVVGGLLIQLTVTLLAMFFYRRMHPLRRRGNAQVI